MERGVWRRKGTTHEAKSTILAAKNCVHSWAYRAARGTVQSLFIDDAIVGGRIWMNSEVHRAVLSDLFI